MFFPLTKQLKSMARTLSRESSRFLDSQEMSHILWDLQVHRRVHGMYREPDEWSPCPRILFSRNI